MHGAERAKMIRVVGLAGSPQRGGDTEKLLDRFLAGASDAGALVTKILVTDAPIEGWTPEIECRAGSRLVSDAFERVSEEMVAADVIAVATPVYFRNVPAQLKAWIDRGQCQWIRKFVDRVPLAATAAGHERRRGILISTGGNDRGYFQGTIETVRGFLGVYETDYWGELLISGTNHKRIEEEPLALQQAYDLGFRAVAEAWS